MLAKYATNRRKTWQNPETSSVQSRNYGIFSPRISSVVFIEMQSQPNYLTWLKESISSVEKKYFFSSLLTVVSLQFISCPDVPWRTLRRCKYGPFIRAITITCMVTLKSPLPGKQMRATRSSDWTAVEVNFRVREAIYTSLSTCWGHPFWFYHIQESVSNVYNGLNSSDESRYWSTCWVGHAYLPEPKFISL